MKNTFFTRRFVSALCLSQSRVCAKNSAEMRISMQIKNWDKLPHYMQTKEVKKYYDIIHNKRISLILKRIFDIVISFIMLVMLSPIMLIISVMVIVDSRGPVFFRQERITQYGRKFRIFKFRTMVSNAQELGTQVTVNNDSRITRVGKVLRKLRIDEIPQLINIFIGDMTFVGTRPEVEKYVKHYTKEMYATLLLPAGLTSNTSIQYKDEDKILEGAKDIDDVYIHQVLPEKMKYNLMSIKEFSFAKDIATMFATFFAVIK